jgi:hypothetical protein
MSTETTTSTSMTEAGLSAALRKHYAGNGMVYLPQVRSNTGYSGQVRTADAIVVSTWPSRGIYAVGIEIKVSKSDLKSELSKPEKAHEIGKFCHQWWLATPVGLTKEMEIPPAWGVLEVAETGKVKIKSPCRINEHVEEPSWLFVAAVLRCVSDCYVPVREVEALTELRLAEIKKARLQTESYEIVEMKREIERLRSSRAAFEEASGVNLDTWNTHTNIRIGQAVREVLAGKSNDPIGRLKLAKGMHEQWAKEIDEAISRIDDGQERSKSPCQQQTAGRG